MKKSFIFPNTSTNGYYDTLGQYIYINIESKELLNIDKKNYIDRKSILPTLHHETKHWIDHNSTLWGIHNIINIFNAYNTYLSKEIKNFYKIAILMNSFKYYDSTSYYQEKGVSDYKPRRILDPLWKYTVTSGYRFDRMGYINEDEPILFYRFLSPTNELIQRVPITIKSLLETSAVYEEYYLHVADILLSLGDDEKLIEIEMLQNKIYKLCYDFDYTLYSVAVHLTANILILSDFIEAFKISSEVSNIVLNLPDHLYDVVKLGDDFYQDNINIKFIRNRDKGFLFYTLLKNYSKSYNNENKIFNIETLLKDSNLPTKEELEKIILIEMTNSKSKLVMGPIKNLAIKNIEKGINFFRQRGLSGSFQFLLNQNEGKIIPNIIYNDTYFDDIDINNTLNKLSRNEEISFQEWYILSDYLKDKIIEFSEGCY